MNKNFLKITPLGGLGEIGLNCQLWETPKGIVMVDCGLMFPDESYLGVDIIIPQFDTITQFKSKFLGIILTHGHEDHIGALPWLVPLVKGVEIFASRLTLAFVEHKLKERNLLQWAKLTVVDQNSPQTLGDLKFNFFPVCHSIPEGHALGVETPIGRIVHTGDFKIDENPLSGAGTDLKLFEKFAEPEGIRLLLSDSTNVEQEGFSLSERMVKKALHEALAKAKGRIIITLFSSHIQRIQEVFDIARELGKTVIISGKSLVNNIEKAQDLGFLQLPPSFFNAYYQVPSLPNDKIILLVTGTQGEPLSALSRMVAGEHRQLFIKKGDTVILSSRIIPGNTRAISKMINEMYRRGAEVYNDSFKAIHASGHAHVEELKIMLNTLKPEYFVPIHGEYRHLFKHSRLAISCGVKAKNSIILEDGYPLTLFSDSVRREEPIPANFTLVDGKGVGDVGQIILKERQILGEEGLVLVILNLDTENHIILYGPKIISKGFAFEQIYDHLLEDSKCLVLDCIEDYFSKKKYQLEDSIKSSLRKFFKRTLGRDPIIIPIIILN